MSQFTLYENLSPASRRTYPYFVDIQSDLLESLNTRLVIPLVAASRLGTALIERVCIETTVKGKPHVLLTQQLTNVPLSALRSPVGSLAHLRAQIVAAVDFLVTGI